MFERLLEENYIGTMKLKNRMIVPAMSTRFVGDDGKATEQFIAYHETRAKGGWALLITENIVIDKGVGAKKELPGLWEDEQIEGYKKLTERIHRADGRICAQIYHAGRNTHSGITGVHNVAPSPICDPSNREIPYELSVEEIKSIEEKFANAALRAKKAGFDAVELHGAHGYLIAQFLSPYSNKRCDMYGGSLENRARFAIEIVRAVREKVGEDYPLIFRISGTEFIPQGMNIEHAKAICMLLKQAGVDAINCSQSSPATAYNTVPSFYVSNGAFVELASEIKKVVNVPVITVGRINSPHMAEEILESGKADIIAMGRASVADPELPHKVEQGDTEAILTCIGCCQGCLGNTIKKKSLTCLVNPFAGKETLYSPQSKTAKPKKVFVIGGGISGCEAAIVSAMKGHTVTLVEKTDRLGGQWIAASMPNHKSEFTSFIGWQKLQLERLGVKVILKTSVTREMIVSELPDVIFNATGSQPIMFNLEGIENIETVTAHEILLGKKSFGKHPLIIGGGMVGAETAEYIARYGVPVELVEMRDGVAVDCEPGPKYFLMKSLKELNVNLHTSAKTKRIEGNAVIIEKNNSEQRIEDVDQIIFAVGVRSNQEINSVLDGIDVDIIHIGDVASTKNGLANVQEAFYEAQKIN